MRISSIVIVTAVVTAVTGCRRSSSSPEPARDARVVRAGVQDVAPARIATPTADLDAGQGTHYEPHWNCRITGPGRVGRVGRLDLPPPRPGAPAGSIEDTVHLPDGRVLRREMVRNEAGEPVLDRGRIALRSSADAGVTAQHEYAVREGMQEMLFVDARGVGVAFWDGHRIVAERIDGTTDEAFAESASDLSRPCSGTSGDALRLWPVYPRPLAFPRVQGMPPSVADARYTISRDEQGLCVSRLEGEGPWGRVFVAAIPDAGMRGELSLSESVNPVTCGPVVAESH